MASKLIVTRKNAWLNRRQGFKVFINGKQVGAIKNDSTEEYELTPGSYQVQCKVNWMSSNEFTADIKQDKNTYVAVTGAMKYYLPLYVLLIVGLFLPSYFTFAKLPRPDWVYIAQLVLIIPALIYMVFYLSLYRRRYLVLKEDDTNPFR